MSLKSDNWYPFLVFSFQVGPLASLAGVLSSLVVLLLLIHWKQLKKPHLALMKLTVLVGTLFGMGTLPWQQNFAGLIAGLMCGMLLTIALVPFVSVTKYGRKSKVSSIVLDLCLHLRRDPDLRYVVYWYHPCHVRMVYWYLRSLYRYLRSLYWYLRSPKIREHQVKNM